MSELYLSMKQCFKATAALLEQIEAAHKAEELKGIVAVLNGGLFPAYWLRKLWRAKGIELPLLTVDVRSYGEYKKQGKIEILSKPDIGSGKGWVFVDEICDTGKTFEALRELYPEAVFASMTCKTDAAVDLHALKYDPAQWIVFPWETAESEG